MGGTGTYGIELGVEYLVSSWEIAENDHLEGESLKVIPSVDEGYAVHGDELSLQSQLATRSATSTDQVSEAELKLGLLAYPVLQAADILLYK